MTCKQRTLLRSPNSNARNEQLPNYCTGAGQAGAASAQMLPLALRRHSFILGCCFGTQSSLVSAGLAARARLLAATEALGQLDDAGGRGWELAARHWPQLRQIVVPAAGSAVGHRIEGMLPRPWAVQATCSVSRAQLEQWR
jgi:hypothetical protein